ncbi:MAG: hypothetical protein PHQ96_05440 [Candidatus Omnitrophica bacterium]|nr:hypothetical protein [Candidatus Omnitrophota bacterium]
MKEKTASMVDACLKSYGYIIERIKLDHPGWVQKDGACSKCVEYYKNL